MKPRKPLPRASKPIARRTPLPRPSKPLARTPIKRRTTKRKAKLLDKTRGALDRYFSFAKHGIFEFEVDHAVKPCQICGRPMTREDADPCHKWRRHHNRHEAGEILAGHRACHTWLDNGAHQVRTKWAQLDAASCEGGGVVKWPVELKAQLEEFLATGTDRLRVNRMVGNEPESILSKPTPA